MPLMPSFLQPREYSGLPAIVCRRDETSCDLSGLVQQLKAESECLMWLDSARQHPATGRYSMLGWDPWLTMETRGASSQLRYAESIEECAGSPLTTLRRLLGRYSGPQMPVLPPGLGWFVVVGYELNQWIERLPPPKSGQTAPELLVFGMQGLFVVDHTNNHTWCVSVINPFEAPARARRLAYERLERMHAWLQTEQSTWHPVGEPSTAPTRIEPTMSQADFETMVRAAQVSIADGEIFQANLAQRFTAEWTQAPWGLYQRLRAINPSPFACYLQTPEVSLVSCSPERLVRVHDGRLEARPIAGTRPRGGNAQEDLLNSLELILSDKERAEHIMLVDLARNDLGRICRYGSVRVEELMALEEYSHVIHIVSNVVGTLRRGVDAVDVLSAMFPGGTITGCPKVRSMEIIHALEPVPRGLYTGSCGWLGFDGSLDLNILIRTMVLLGQQLSFHVGAGIVADSQPEREYHETLAKAQALFRALDRSSTTLACDAAIG